VTESHLISGLVHQLVAAEHTHTFAESEALLPLLPQHLGQAGTMLCALLNADDATVNQLMHALQAARPEADFLAWKAALASERRGEERGARAPRAPRPARRASTAPAELGARSPVRPTDLPPYPRAELAAALRAHLEREQKDAFPPLAQKLGAAERTALLNAYAAAKARAPAPTVATALLESAKGFGSSVANLISKAVAALK
jgi:hypothetical protein